MIYYFSGTGNSRYIANRLSNLLEDNTSFIPNTKFESYTNVIGFVFPIYSWGVPPIVLDFIANLPMCNQSNIYCYMVATCGDDIGLSAEMLEKALNQKGIVLNAAFSIQMPNTYVLLPGFDVDPTNIENNKLNASDERVSQIYEAIKYRRQIKDVTKGALPWIKTKIIFPLFRKYGVNSKYWHTTELCTGCGLCEKTCPISNINIIEGKPQWNDKCISCTACYHVCPHNAIKYASFTNKKGQYKTLIHI